MCEASVERARPAGPVIRMGLAVALAALIGAAVGDGSRAADGKAEKKSVPAATKSTVVEARPEDDAKAREKAASERRAKASAIRLQKAASFLLDFGGDDGQPRRVKESGVDLIARRQLMSRMQRYVQQELYFFHKTCELKPAQWRELLTLTEKGCREILNKSTSGNPTTSIQVRVGNTYKPVPLRFEGASRTLAMALQNLVLDAARKTLTPTQMARLDKGVEERAAFRRRAFVLYTVSVLDDQLTLTPEQSERLIPKLTNEWKDRTSFPLNVTMGETDSLPEIQESVLKEILTERQMKVWTPLPKYGIHQAEDDTFFQEPASEEGQFDLSRLDPRFADDAANGSEPASEKVPVKQTAPGKSSD